MVESRSRRRPWVYGMGTAALLSMGFLAACADTAEEDPAEPTAQTVQYDPEPQVLGDQLEEVDTEDAQVPIQLQLLSFVEPGWDTAPQEASGVFLAPGDSGGKLTFSAVDAEGTLLWQAERPLSCAGFTLSTDGERALAVLSDLEEELTGATLGNPTVTAYDLHTGEEVWGPVDVPGLHQGPGMLFAAPPEENFGDLGPRVVLDPGSGEIAFDEREDDTLQVLGEYHGLLLVAEGDQLRAYKGAGEEPQWSVPLSDYGWDGETLYAHQLQTSGAPGAALVGAGPGDYTLIDLATGEVMAEHLREAAQEPTSGNWVTLGDELSGFDDAGQEIFSIPDTAGWTMQVVGGVLVYLNSQDQVHVYNVATGEQAQAYGGEGEGPLARPVYITETGEGVIEFSDRVLLGVVDEDPEL